jgi:hypothetical protein
VLANNLSNAIVSSNSFGCKLSSCIACAFFAKALRRSSYDGIALTPASWNSLKKIINFSTNITYVILISKRISFVLSTKIHLLWEQLCPRFMVWKFLFEGT